VQLVYIRVLYLVVGPWLFTHFARVLTRAGPERERNVAVALLCTLLPRSGELRIAAPSEISAVALAHSLLGRCESGVGGFLVAWTRGGARKRFLARLEAMVSADGVGGVADAGFVLVVARPWDILYILVDHLVTGLDGHPVFEETGVVLVGAWTWVASALARVEPVAHSCANPPGRVGLFDQHYRVVLRTWAWTEVAFCLFPKPLFLPENVGRPILN